MPPASVRKRESLIHVSVPEKAREGRGRFKADWSFDLIERGSWSAHVHVIPPGQIVPLHHHPKNDELSWVASGTGEWRSQVQGGAALKTEVQEGALLASPKGSAHSMRNRGVEDLVVVVVHRPSFGQNWYLEADELESAIRAPVVTKGTEVFPGLQFPEGFLSGWDLDFEGAHSVPAQAADTLYLNRWGRGSLVFEETELPIEPGDFIRIPPGLAAQFRTAAATEPLTLVRLTIPRSP